MRICRNVKISEDMPQNFNYTVEDNVLNLLKLHKIVKARIWTQFVQDLKLNVYMCQNSWTALR